MKQEKISVTEDQALAQDRTLASLVKEKELEGYIVSHHYMHEAVGKVVVMKHVNFMEKALSHRDYLEKGRRGL